MVTTSLARHALVAAALVACAGGALRASSPKFFVAATQADFLKGDLDNLSVDTRGQLTLGPASEVVYETPSPFLWTVVPAADGTLYVGTGNDGRVYKIDPQGRGSQVFDATELEIHAIAPAPNGGLYAASSPDGKIYRIDRNGAATTFFDPEEKYIWALATDTKGNLFAATGEKGVVYKIGADGKGAVFYNTKATHATALAVDRAGNLIVGTESPGRVVRVDADGKGFLLLDTPYQEIRTLKFDEQGVLFVAAANGRANSGSAPSTPADSSPQSTGGASGGAPVATVSVSTEITAVVVDSGAPAPTNGGTRPLSGASKGAVYRIAADGLWDQMWDSREDLPYDLTFDAQGRLVVATGDKGKIYRLEGDPVRPMLLARAPASQVTSLYRDARGRISFATANPGKVFRLSPDRAPRGTYEGEVRDAQMVSSWGAISWRGATPNGSKIEMSTRSGNTETPDETWSPWSSPYAAPGAPISSPKARYIQWRAALTGTGDGPALTSVTTAYLPRNLRPQVRSVTVQPPGIVFQKPYSTGDPELAGFENLSTPERKLAQAAQNQAAGSSLGRRTYQKGLETLQWRADDENDDELTYEVEYRREGDPTWKVLRKNLSETILVWDTTTVPNGTYFVRVIASDAPSNSGATALTGELDSNAFDIDNAPPVFSAAAARVDANRTLVTIDVRDDQSAISKVEYSQNGEEWTAVFPADGIADSKAEHYEIAIDGRVGPRGITLRAIDAMNNVSTTQVEVPAAR
ncbi:MAG: PQQ-binding-like beta-propeller repeat protein [Vicinamibacterales bacterium]